MILGLLVLLGLAAPGPAAAQDGGFYAGFSLGEAKYRHTCRFYEGICDPTDTAYRIFVGSYVTPSIGVELGYANLADVFVDGTVGGTNIATHFEGTAKAADISVLPTLVISERFALFGRFGIYRSQLEVRSLSPRAGTRSEHNTAWTFGAGARFDFGRRLTLRAEWQRYDSVGGSTTGVDDIDYMNAGLIWNF